MRTGRPGIARAWVAAIALLAATSATAADAIVGSVLAVRGAVFTESAGSLQPLTANAPVREGDAIVSRSGKARIALEDGSIVSVGENARVHVGRHERTPAQVNARLALVSGALRLFVAKVAPGGAFEVETETAIAAVRGTDWLIEATPEQTSVALLSGRVAVSAHDDPRASVMLALPGHGTDVRRGAAPAPPIPWGARRLADLLARATFNQ